MSKNPAGKLSFQHPTKIYKHYICVCVFPSFVNRFFLRVVCRLCRFQEWESIELCSSPECWKPLISCWDPAVYLISRQFHLSRCWGNALADFCRFGPGTSQNVVGMGRGGWMCFRRKIAYNHITKQYQICGFVEDVFLHPRCFVSFQTVHFVGLGQMLHKSLPAQSARQELLRFRFKMPEISDAAWPACRGLCMCVCSGKLEIVIGYWRRKQQPTVPRGIQSKSKDLFSRDEYLERLEVQTYAHLWCIFG